MALDRTCVTLTDGHALHVHFLTNFEKTCSNNVASLHLGSFGYVDTEFFEDGSRLNTRFSMVSGSSAVYARSAALTVCDLNSGIAICVRRFDLRHTVVRHVHYG